MPELPDSFDVSAITAIDAFTPGVPAWRVGQGWDRHRLAPLGQPAAGADQPTRPLRLGGVAIASTLGVIAHSDGDALLHAITDALLAACGAPDLGFLFPDNDNAHDGADSATFLKAAAAILKHRGWSIANLDATVLLQTPRIAPYRADICNRIASVLDIPLHAISLKGKSGEGVDAVGESRAVEASAVALLSRGRAKTVL